MRVLPFSWMRGKHGPMGWPMALVCAFFYLGFHAVSGERGLVAWWQASRHLEALQAELSATTTARETYERRLRLLSSHSLDLDMLDEQARTTLGFVNPNDVVVLTKPLQ